MAGKNQRSLIKKLKKQVRLLQRKHNQGRTQLKSALKKLAKQSRSYKKKLTAKVRSMQGKLSASQAATYTKVAKDLERQLVRGIKAKAKSLSNVISKLEKKSIAKIKKGFAKKAKKTGNTKRKMSATKGSKRPAQTRKTKTRRRSK